jgi:hypothetical protein
VDVLLPTPRQSVLSPDDAEFIAGVRRLGATSPAAARPVAELPRLRASRFDQLLDLGVLREGPVGTFYLYESSPFIGDRAIAPEPMPPGRRLAKVAAFWVLLILVAALFFQLSQ